MQDNEHNYLSMTEEIEKWTKTGLDFILNGKALKKLFDKVTVTGWYNRMNQKHTQYRKRALKLKLNYIPGDVNSAIKDCDSNDSLMKDIQEHWPKMSRLESLSDKATLSVGSVQLVEENYILKYIIALNALKKDITNAAQVLLKGVTLNLYLQLKYHYSFDTDNTSSL